MRHSNAIHLTQLIFATTGLALALVSAKAQTPFPLWDGTPPSSLGEAPHDIPTLTPYPATETTATGAAIVVLPGGGYGGLASHEGKDYALFLNEHGISAFVLQYRLGSHGYRHPVMLGDAARAIRLVRHLASQWNLDPVRIGIMGSSAGGHLASTLLTHFDAGNPDAPDPVDAQSSRPTLGILCYPVISMGAITHQGSKRNLLGEKPDPKLVWELSNELQVTPETPPCFVWHTYEDQAVLVENSLEFGRALAQAGVPFDLHIYEKGRHGIGLANGHPWTKDCIYWLQEHGFARQ